MNYEHVSSPYQEQRDSIDLLQNPFYPEYPTTPTMIHQRTSGSIEDAPFVSHQEVLQSPHPRGSSLLGDIRMVIGSMIYGFYMEREH